MSTPPSPTRATPPTTTHDNGTTSRPKADQETFERCDEPASTADELDQPTDVFTDLCASPPTASFSPTWPAPITITRTQAGRVLNIAPCTFDKMRRRGQLTVAPIDWNGRLRWSRTAIAQWLDGGPDMADDDFALLTTTQVARHLAAITGISTDRIGAQFSWGVGP